jgi:hypothetical protein
MKAPLCCVLVLVTCSLSLLAQNKAAAPKTVKETVDVVGIVPRTVTDASPYASAKLIVTKKPVRAGQPVKVQFKLVNRSDQSLSYIEPMVFLELRDREGKLAQETELGCAYDFFSPCHTDSQKKLPNPARKRSMVPPHAEELSVLSLTSFYTLRNPGTYTLTGYVCGLEQAANASQSGGPECFKTRKVKLKVARTRASEMAPATGKTSGED